MCSGPGMAKIARMAIHDIKFFGQTLAGQTFSKLEGVEVLLHNVALYFGELYKSC